MAFELVRQRTSSQSDLLIVLDEPFAGVTDDFVPFITARLYEMQRKHSSMARSAQPSKRPPIP